MKTYNPTLAANEVYTVAGGNSFHLISAGFGINVQYLKADLTDINETATDVEAGYFVNYPQSGFDLVKITNGATAQTIKFGVARDGEGGYNIGASNIVGGTVDAVTLLTSAPSIEDAINGHNALNDNCFSVGVNLSGAAGQYSILQMANPSNSGINVIVKSACIYNGGAAAQVAQIRDYSFGDIALVSGALSERNKRIDGAAGSCIVTSGSTPSAYGTVASSRIIAPNFTQEIEMIKSDPFVLAPDTSLLLYILQVNNQANHCVEWEEVLI